MRTALSLLTGVALMTGPAIAQVQPLDDCLLVGDSTIVGTAPLLQKQLGKVCRVQARTGVGTTEILTWPAIGSYRLALIGAGSNDAASPNLRGNLARLRAGIRAVRVVWLVPYDPRAARAVDAVAAQHGDHTVPLSGFASRDRVHPISYAAVARYIAARRPADGVRSGPVAVAAIVTASSRTDATTPVPFDRPARRAEIISASLN